jgi:hypothetical protein
MLGVMRDVLEWETLPVCLEDLHMRLIAGSSRLNIIVIFLLRCLTWSLWLIRNDFVLNDILIPCPDVGMYRAISFIQKWKILSKEKDHPSTR